MREALQEVPSHSQFPAPLLTVSQALRVLAMSRSEFYRNVKARKLTLIKRGRRTFVSATEVASFIQRLLDGAQGTALPKMKRRRQKKHRAGPTNLKKSGRPFDVPREASDHAR